MQQDLKTMAQTLQKNEAIERQIRRYHPSFRRRVRQYAGLSPRLADLVTSFPAAVVAIVSPELNASARGTATRMAKDGESLREVSRVLGVPYWARRLPPEVLAQPLNALPVGSNFEGRMAQLVPKNPEAARRWLQWVQFGHCAANSEFAMWLASQKFFQRELGLGFPLLPLAAYAWYSGVEEGAARELIDEPWNRRMPFSVAATATIAWIEKIVACFEAPRIRRRGPGRYSRQRVRNGYRVVPLRTAAQLHQEGSIMNHCVATYAALVAQGVCTILSVRVQDKRVATVEIRPRGTPGGGYAIVQLQGPGNTRVSEQIWRAVLEWLAVQPADPHAMLGVGDEFVISPERWERIWRPYVTAKGVIGLSAEAATLNRLRRDADALRQIIASSSR